MFQYAPKVTAETKHHVSTAFLALKDACHLPDGSKYILSVDGGLNNSPEGHTKGMEVRPAPLTRIYAAHCAPLALLQHAYVLAFRSTAERDYYLDVDPAHQAFKASIAEKVSDVVVFDFESGDFARRTVGRRRRPSDELHVRTV